MQKIYVQQKFWKVVTCQLVKKQIITNEYQIEIINNTTLLYTKSFKIFLCIRMQNKKNFKFITENQCVVIIVPFVFHFISYSLEFIDFFLEI